MNTREHLRVSSEGRALSPNRSPKVPEQRQGSGTLASLRYTGRTPSGLGSTEPEPQLPPPQPPAAVAAASAKPSFRHPRRCLTTCRPRPLLELGRPPGNEYGQGQTQGSSTGGRRGRLARTLIVEAEAAATVVPPEAREEGLWEASPDTLCATGSLTPLPPSLPSSGCGYCPSPTRASRNLPAPRPPASASRGPGTRPGIPPSFLGTVAGRARAPQYRRTPSTCSLGCGARLGMEWVGAPARLDRLYGLNQLRLRKPFPAMFRDKGMLAFIKRTLFAVP